MNLDYESVDPLLKRARRRRGVVLVVIGSATPIVVYVAFQWIGHAGLGIADNRAPTGNELAYGCFGVLVFLGSLVYGLTAIVRGIVLLRSTRE